MPSLIKPGETDAALKTITFPIFSTEGRLATGGADDDWEYNVVATSTGATLEVQNNLGSWSSAAGTFGHNGAGEYYYTFANAECAVGLTPGSIAFRFTKTNFRTQVARVDFRVLSVNASSLDAGSISVATFASDVRARLFREIYAGAVSSPAAGTVTLPSGTYTAGSLRGAALYVYSGTGIGQSWAVAWNAGTNGRTLTLVGGDAWRVNTDGTSLVVLFSQPDSFGSLFDRGGVDPTNGRQQLGGIAAAMLGDQATNVGQPDQGQPAVFFEENGDTVLEASVSNTTGAKSTAWAKGAA